MYERSAQNLNIIIICLLYRYSHTAAIINNRLMLVGGVTFRGHPGVTVIDLDTLSVKEFSVPVSIFLEYDNHLEYKKCQCINHLFLIFSIVTFILKNVCFFQICKTRLPVLLYGHQVAFADDKQHRLFVIGGGSNCFSFGTHLNELCSITLPDTLFHGH